MISKGVEAVTTAIEYVNQSLEATDPEATNRPVVFGQAPAKVADNKSESTSIDQLKVVTGDLLDLWMFEGFKGLEYLKATSAYKLTDPYIDYIAKFEQVKIGSLNLKTQVEKVASDLNQRIMLFVNETTNFVGLLIQLAKEKQETLKDYISKTYSNVRVFIQDNWIRLDFNADGQVDLDDVR